MLFVTTVALLCARACSISPSVQTRAPRDQAPSKRLIRDAAHVETIIGSDGSIGFPAAASLLDQAPHHAPEHAEHETKATEDAEHETDATESAEHETEEHAEHPVIHDGPPRAGVTEDADEESGEHGEDDEESGEHGEDGEESGEHAEHSNSSAGNATGSEGTHEHSGDMVPPPRADSADLKGEHGFAGDEGPVGPAGDAGPNGPKGGEHFDHPERFASKTSVYELLVINTICGILLLIVGSSKIASLLEKEKEVLRISMSSEATDTGPVTPNVNATWKLTETTSGVVFMFYFQQEPTAMTFTGSQVRPEKQELTNGTIKESTDGKKGTDAKTEFTVEWTVDGTVYSAKALVGETPGCLSTLSEITSSLNDQQVGEYTAEGTERVEGADEKK